MFELLLHAVLGVFWDCYGDVRVEDDFLFMNMMSSFIWQQMELFIW